MDAAEWISVPVSGRNVHIRRMKEKMNIWNFAVCELRFTDIAALDSGYGKAAEHFRNETGSVNRQV